MLRRDLLSLLLAPRVDYRDYSRVAPEFLTRLAAEAYARRNRALAGLTNKDAIVQRQAWARETFWALIGGQPAERGPVPATVTGGFERDSYRVEHLIYQTRPGLYVPANLYLPRGSGARYASAGKYPAVLFQMGHSLNGKAASFYQYCCQGLAQLGFVVLAFDPMGQGERTYYPRPGENLTRLDSADDEHTVPGKQLILAGLTSTQIQVWDAVRSLDYLAQHPMVDSKRIGTTGNSGGGTLSMMLAGVDDRLACASLACPNTENLACENFNAPGSTDDAEQNLLDSGPRGFDRWDIVYPFAPKPLQILISAKDFFGTYSPRYVENGRAEFARLRNVYRVLGREADLEWSETALPHGLSYELRMAIYRWFRLHLQGIREPLGDEPPVRVETDAALYASKSGNVVRDMGGLTPRAMAQNAAAAKQPGGGGPDDLRKLLVAGSFAGAATKKGDAASRRARVEAWEIESEPGVFLPAWVFRSKGAGGGAGTLIVLDSSGRNAQWNEDAICQGLAASGVTVWAVDVRGIGDLRPEFPRHAPGHGRSHQEEEAYAWSSLMLGRPLVGQRVTDILAVVKAAGAGRAVRIAARGSLTIPALFAAELAPDAVQGVLAVGGPASYRELLQREDAGPTANLLFDVLATTDLPKLARGRVVRGQRWDEAALGEFAKG